MAFCCAQSAINRLMHLKWYIDVVDGRLFAKIVNTTNDPNDEAYLHDLEELTAIRAFHKKYRHHANIADVPSEMPVYIPLDDVTKHPNHTALTFHKAACLIWKLAGAGAINQVQNGIADSPSEMPVYIPLKDKTMHPNHTALVFHKAACLIWKLAGAGAVNEDDWSGDSEEVVENCLAMVASRLEDLQKTLKPDCSVRQVEIQLPSLMNPYH
ncbi:hypothetical protein HDU77_000668 [Chytriomyces hyalinus]|nr:hypothetical protein HDU77_000668 [Chytriomyces hyalinus]